MDSSDELPTAMAPNPRRFQASMAGRFVLGLFWCLLHVFVSVVHAWLHLFHLLMCYVISTVVLRRYQKLDLRNLRCLAIVVDSEEAKDVSKIKVLLWWLTDIGVENVILYDMEGVLKKSMESDGTFSISRNESYIDDGRKTTTLSFHEERLTIELLSFSDNKEGIAKAASFLCSRFLKDDLSISDKVESVVTEADITGSLKAVGFAGPDPDLLLVYGPARCHLGFPAWRMRYTEIVHMGQLKCMRHSALLKAIYDYSKKHQNYGS